MILTKTLSLQAYLTVDCGISNGYITVDTLVTGTQKSCKNKKQRNNTANNKYV